MIGPDEDLDWETVESISCWYLHPGEGNKLRWCVMSAAIETLEERAEALRGQLERERRSLAAHEKGALRQAQEALQDETRLQTEKRASIQQAEADLDEINRAINALRGVRAVADRPQA